jgi:hypothetical protein
MKSWLPASKWQILKMSSLPALLDWLDKISLIQRYKLLQITNSQVRFHKKNLFDFVSLLKKPAMLIPYFLLPFYRGKTGSSSYLFQDQFKFLMVAKVVSAYDI